jgi:hypothetical protein
MTVYKYGTAERLDVLIKGRIRFTPPNALNDPFELRPHFDNIIPEPELLEKLESVDLRPALTKVYEKLPAAQKSLMSLDMLLEMVNFWLKTEEGRQTFWQTIGMGMGTLRDLTPGFREKVAEGLGSRIGILSVSQVATDPLMWAHYADSHRGIVIGLDDGDDFFNRRRSSDDEFYWLRPVHYRDPKAGLTLRDLDGVEVLARKGPQWSYEKELRVLAPLSDAAEVIELSTGPIHLFDIPPSAITELILGARSTAAVREAAAEVVANPRYQHVRLRQAILDTLTQGVTIEPD